MGDYQPCRGIRDLRPQTSDLRPQTSDRRPQTADRRGVKCPECGTTLVIAPKGSHTYVVCYAALGGDGVCWYYRELPAKKKGVG